MPQPCLSNLHCGMPDFGCEGTDIKEYHQKKTTFNYLNWCKSIGVRAALQGETRRRRHVVGCNWLWLLQIKHIYIDVKAKLKRCRTLTPIGLCPTPTCNDTPFAFAHNLLSRPLVHQQKHDVCGPPHPLTCQQRLLLTCQLVISLTLNLVNLSTGQLVN